MDLSTSSLERLTPWRNNKHTVPTSFSPDGSMLAAASQDGRGYRAIGIDLRTGRTRVLARNARDPVFSPDGSRLALISYRDGQVSTDEEGDPVLAGELYVKSLLDGGMTRLTRSERQDESAPSWDPSGERLAYARRVLEAGSLSVAMQINADGTCPRLVLGATRARPQTAYGAPTWQPGPGRGAGRIAC